jgi:glycosyltransferase involved in cell wall biosynthesis
VRISVVVPFRNEERHIGRCLTALTAQEGLDGGYEVVAVADRSSDRSAEIARRFPAVRVLLDSHAPGPYAARNAGIAASSGEIVAFTDADCEPRPDWLSELADVFRSVPVSAVLGARDPGRDSSLLSLLYAYDRARDDYIFNGGHADLYYCSANNCAFRREVFAQLGPFVERRRGGDLELLRRLVESSGPEVVAYSPRVRIKHLEIEHVSDYYRKSFVYARSLRRLKGRIGGRPLRNRERLSIWWAAARAEPASAARSAALLALLGGGAACWGLGRLSGSFGPDAEPAAR